MTKSLLTTLRKLTVAAPKGTPTDTVTLFSPRDNNHEALTEVLNSAQESIKAAMFTLTDSDLVTILKTKAAQPGFTFQLTLDATEAKTVPAMTTIVTEFATDPRVVVGNSSKGAFSHLKVWVVDHTYIVSGSTNATASGELAEDNELVVRKHPVLASVYEARLDEIYAYMTSKRPVS